MQTEQTLKELAKKLAEGFSDGLPYIWRGDFALFSKFGIKQLIYFSMKKGYELGMEDAKEALKQQTNSK